MLKTKAVVINTRPMEVRTWDHRNLQVKEAAALASKGVNDEATKIAFAFTLTYLWVLMILLGAILFDTLVLYPNIFHDVPRSLETAMEFMVIRGPGDFFRLLGPLAWLTGIGSLILVWRETTARYWIMCSLIIILCDGLVSMAFFWPRNTIMFTEGAAVHSAAYLQQTAQEIQIVHWLRVAMTAVASALSFVGFLKFHRHTVTSQDAHHEAEILSSVTFGVEAEPRLDQ